MKLNDIRRYLLQLDRSTFKQGVVHHLYISSDVEYGQMILSIKHQAHVLQILHDDQGHQGMEWAIVLCRNALL